MPNGMENLDIGQKLTEFRRTNNLTIKDVAERTGLSPALLSQLERNIGNPTLSALQAIANALGVTLSSLLEQHVDNESLIMRKERQERMVYSGDEHTVYNVLTSSPVHSKLELLLMTLKPHGVTHGGFVQHKKEEEIAYVIRGEAVVVFEKEEFVLLEEDSIRILPGRKHLFRNDSEEEVKVLFVKNKP